MRRAGARYPCAVADSLDKRRQKILISPSYCEYASGQCEHDMPEGVTTDALFLYPSEPAEIAVAVEAAAAKLTGTGSRTRTWKHLKIGGQTIYCEIDKAMRSARTIVADVTTLNFNLMFEVGYAIGLGLPVLPIRDSSYVKDKRAFAAVGVLDTLGYVDFQNSDQLVDALAAALPGQPVPVSGSRFYRESPLYVLPGPIKTEGVIQLMSTLKKSRIKFRVYDQDETARISLPEVIRQVSGSVGVVAHLLSDQRQGAVEHNALAAFVAGLAMAAEKVVVILDGSSGTWPIDYRDVVLHYSSPGQIPALLDTGLNRVLDFMQTGSFEPALTSAVGLLRDLDWGDVAAENEVAGLDAYFVETGQYLQARQGHARLVVGRKGSGKTAIFFEVRSAQSHGHDTLVIDMKPEGHQFARLREYVLDSLKPGTQEHTLVAFWTYLLLTEIARKALEADRSWASRDPLAFQRHRKLEELYERHDPGQLSDFSQRLQRQVDRVARRMERLEPAEAERSITQVIYEGDVRELTDGVADYLEGRDSVWLLVDNLDKGWPVKGSTSMDILIIRALLAATRKLQHMLESRRIGFRCLVFLRSDIFEHLQQEIPDKGKDTAIRLDWEDPAQFEQIVARRIESSTGLSGEFQTLWHQVCAPLVQTQDSFGYILERTLMRPRDLLRFLHRAVDVAINRGHNRVSEEDVLQAERGYSEDMLVETAFEIADTHPEFSDILLAFQNSPSRMDEEEARLRLMVAGIKDEHARTALELLIWFGFFGVAAAGMKEPKFAYEVQGNMRRLLFPLEMQDAVLVAHPAFHAALDIELRD